VVIAYLAELGLVLIPGTVIAMLDALVNWGHIPFAVIVLSLGWNVFAPAIRLLVRPALSISDREWTKIRRYAVWALLTVSLWVAFLIAAYSNHWSWDRGTWIQIIVIAYGYVLPALVGVHWFFALRRERAKRDPMFARSLQPAIVRCAKCNSPTSFEAPSCSVCGYLFGT
jgi:hypothetical protein